MGDRRWKIGNDPISYLPSSIFFLVLIPAMLCRFVLSRVESC
jgi:hypothetical protein